MTHDALLQTLRQALQGEQPVLLVLAGSNGAGKTTFYELYLETLGLPFVNADRIAARLDPADSARVAYQAAGLATIARRELLQRRQSFCFETVFSDPAGDKLQFLQDAQAVGYRVMVLFFQLSDPMLCVARVAQRVARGGHDVPDEKLQTRFVRTQRNIAAALTFVDLGLVIDNSSAEMPFSLRGIWRRGQCLDVERSEGPNRRECPQ